MYRFIIIKKRSLIVSALLLCFMLLSGVAIYAMAQGEEADGVRLPVLMYHSVLKNPSAAGKYVISPDTFEADMKYLKDNGYTSLLSGDVISFVKEGVPLPEKSIMITLDDGYLNNLTYVVPLLEKYDMKAIISVVGKYSEEFSESGDHNPNYSYFSWEDIKECVASGRVEIGNHTYNMHSQNSRRGSMKKRGESDEEYKKVLTGDVMKTQALLMENCLVEPKVFTYPYGAVSNVSVDIIKQMGFEMSFGCCEKVNILTGDENELYLMCRFNRPSGIGTQEFMKRIE